jgi:hypothetical protein
MLPATTIHSLTSDLLANNAFNHLREDEVSALQQLLRGLKEPLSTIQQSLLLTFWKHASTADVPPSLLGQCNKVLHQMVSST